MATQPATLDPARPVPRHEAVRSGAEWLSHLLTAGELDRCLADAVLLHRDAVEIGDDVAAGEIALVGAKACANHDDSAGMAHWSRLALDGARRCGSPDLTARAHAVGALAAARQALPVDSMRSIRASLAQQGDATPPDTRMIVTVSAGLAFLEMGAIIRAVEQMRRAREAAVDGALAPGVRARMAVNVVLTSADAHDLLLEARPDEAAEMLEAAAALMPALREEATLDGSAALRALRLQSECTLAWRQGDVDRATDFGQRALALASNPLAARPTLIELARASHRAGDTEATRRWIARQRREAPFHDHEMESLAPLMEAAAAAELIGDPDALRLWRRWRALQAWYDQGLNTASVESVLASLQATTLQAEVHQLREVNSGLQRATRELTDLALRDPLTGCLNRRGIADAFLRLRQTAGSISVAIVDLDHFKEVNDRHSHAVGDAVLKTLVQLVQENLRSGDHFGRLGGEEFVALLPGAPDDAVQAAERLRRVVAAYDWQKLSARLAVTLSGGIAHVADDEGLDGAMARADAHLYDAKQSGRNRVLGS